MLTPPCPFREARIRPPRRPMRRRAHRAASERGWCTGPRRGAITSEVEQSSLLRSSSHHCCSRFREKLLASLVDARRVVGGRVRDAAGRNGGSWQGRRLRKVRPGHQVRSSSPPLSCDLDLRMATAREPSQAAPRVPKAAAPHSYTEGSAAPESGSVRPPPFRPAPRCSGGGATCLFGCGGSDLRRHARHAGQLCHTARLLNAGARAGLGRGAGGMAVSRSLRLAGGVRGNEV